MNTILRVLGNQMAVVIASTDLATLIMEVSGH